MKRVIVLSMALVFALMLGLILSSCNMGGPVEDEVPALQVVEYKSYVGEDLYILKITETTEEAARAAYAPKAGDKYELRIRKAGSRTEELISSGIVGIVPVASGSSGTILKLTDDKGTNLQVTVVTATASSDAGGEVEIEVMSSITGTLGAEGGASPTTVSGGYRYYRHSNNRRSWNTSHSDRHGRSI